METTTRQQRQAEAMQQQGRQRQGWRTYEDMLQVTKANFTAIQCRIKDNLMDGLHVPSIEGIDDPLRGEQAVGAYLHDSHGLQHVSLGQGGGAAAEGATG